jgi:hypothetical protein
MIVRQQFLKSRHADHSSSVGDVRRGALCATQQSRTCLCRQISALCKALIFGHSAAHPSHQEFHACA